MGEDLLFSLTTIGFKLNAQRTEKKQEPSTDSAINHLLAVLSFLNSRQL